jgi:serine/threonine protein kinase
MDPASSTFEYLNSPEAAFLEPEDIISRCFMDEKATNQPNTFYRPQYPSYQHRYWKITGCAAGGTLLFTIPLFIKDFPPLRIHTIIPDLYDQIPYIREYFNSASLCHTEFAHIESHPLARHILQTLDKWTDQNKDNITSRLLMLPFASNLMIPEITIDPSTTEIHFVPNYEPEQAMHSVDTLRNQLKNGQEPIVYPEILDLNELVILSQIHDSISLVRCTRDSNDQAWIFKSAVRGYQHLYLELKLLLSIPPHKNILGRPKYIITKKGCFGRKAGVCGFLVEYFPLGSIGHNISLIREERSDQELIELITQIGSALKYLMHNGHFLPDMRTENIVLSEDKGVLRPILIDFEQGENWRTWSPPEVYYHEYLHKLVQCDAIPEKDKEEFQYRLDRIHSAFIDEKELLNYTPPSLEENCAWKCLSPLQRESATVYLLGKLMWCIFEGAISISIIDMFWRPIGEQASLIEFPHFEKTPLSLRPLILKCTEGAPELEDRLSATTRIKSKIYPRNHSHNLGKDQRDIVLATLESSKIWWLDELIRMENFFKNSFRHDTQEFNYNRPCLQDVLDRLENEMIRTNNMKS